MEFEEFLTVICSGLIRSRNITPHCKLSYLPVIFWVKRLNGAGNKEYAKRMKISQPNSYMRLNRLVRAGYLFKENKRYYLTDKGLLVHSTVIRELAPVLGLLK